MDRKQMITKGSIIRVWGNGNSQNRWINAEVLNIIDGVAMILPWNTAAEKIIRISDINKKVNWEY